MSSPSDIQPISTTYSVDSIFNALNRSLIGINSELQAAEASELDTSYSVAQLSSAYETGNQALGHVNTWLKAGIKTVETAIPLNDTNLPPNNPNARLQTQIIRGTLKPTENEPA